MSCSFAVLRSCSYSCEGLKLGNNFETSGGAQQGYNELRYVTLDIDATVPYVVVEETLI